MLFRLVHVFISNRQIDMQQLETVLKNEKYFQIIAPETSEDVDVRSDRRLVLTATDCSGFPWKLRIFRNFTMHGFKNDDVEFEKKADSTPCWEAILCSCAAPKTFEPFKGYIDGGFIRNDPAMDLLHIVQTYNTAMTLQGKSSESKEIGLVLSVGIDRVLGVDRVFNEGQLTSDLLDHYPDEDSDFIKELSESSANDIPNEMNILYDSVYKAFIEKDFIETDENTIANTRSAFHSGNIPYFRFMQLPSAENKENAIYTCDRIIDTLWETMKLMQKSCNDVADLISLLISDLDDAKSATTSQQPTSTSEMKNITKSHCHSDNIVFSGTKTRMYSVSSPPQGSGFSVTREVTLVNLLNLVVEKVLEWFNKDAPNPAPINTNIVKERHKEEEKLEQARQKIEDERQNIYAEQCKNREGQQKIEDELQKIKDEQQKIDAERQKIGDEQQNIYAEQCKNREEQQKIEDKLQKIKDERQKIYAEQCKNREEQQKIEDKLQKIKDERQKIDAERQKIGDEQQNIYAEQCKNREGQQKIEDELQKIKDERQKIDAERQKIGDEQQNIYAEQCKNREGQQKIEDELQKIGDEQQKIYAEQHKNPDEQQKIEDELLKIEDERQKIDAEWQKIDTERQKNGEEWKRKSEELCIEKEKFEALTNKCFEVHDTETIRRIREEAKQKFNIDSMTKYNIAITGQTGSGKSTYVNALCKINDYDEGAAKVDDTQMLTPMQKYQHPNLKTLFIWDCPGAGTAEHSLHSYFMDKYLFLFDSLLIVYDNRLQEGDADLLFRANAFGIPAVVVRNKANKDLESRRMREKDSDKMTSEEIAEMKSKLIQDLKDSAKQEIAAQEAKIGKRLGDIPIFVINAWSTMHPHQEVFEEADLLGYVLTKAKERRSYSPALLQS